MTKIDKEMRWLMARLEGVASVPKGPYGRGTTVHTLEILKHKWYCM